MKTPIHSNLLVRAGLALAFGWAIWASVQAQSTVPPEGARMMDKKIMEHCQELKEEKQKMMAEMNAQDGELALQVSKMNRAPEGKKLDLMAALVTQLVEQRVTRNAQLGKMQAEMMQHMAQHVELGKESMSQCPMIKETENMKGTRDMEDMVDMADVSADAHKEHH